MKIGILLLTSPEHSNTETVHRLCREFVGMGHDVELFLMEDGVYNAVKTDSPLRLSPPLQELTERGVRVYLCSQTLDQRGIREAHLYGGIDLTNQQRLAKMVAGADRFLAFS